MEFGAFLIILSVVGVIYQNRTKPRKGSDQQKLNSPELMLVNVHYNPPASNTQITNYTSISEISINGMTDQQQAYYNP